MMLGSIKLLQLFVRIVVKTTLKNSMQIFWQQTLTLAFETTSNSGKMETSALQLFLLETFNFSSTLARIAFPSFSLVVEAEKLISIFIGVVRKVLSFFEPHFPLSFFAQILFESIRLSDNWVV